MSSRPIISRIQARNEGLKWYFTGEPCDKGHVSPRLVSTRRCRACAREDDRRRYHLDPAKARDRARERSRRRLPAPTRPCPAICELCGRPPFGKRSMHLDHDHKTGLFRGWLCGTCNTSLGKFGDDIAGLQNAVMYLRRNGNPALLPTNAAERKQIPVASGVLDYFPQALIEVAKVSYAGNQQHNPGQPLQWARGKSTDQADTLQRHYLERGTIDVDGLRHSAKMAWRALAILQLEMEAEGAPIARGARQEEK